MNETKITLTAGKTVIPAVLNNNRASKKLIEMLPLTVHLQRYAHDYCGVMPQLPYDEDDLKNGWTNGELAFAADGNYFAILYKDEETSGQYGNLVTLGRISIPPATMETLEAAITVLIDLA